MSKKINAETRKLLKNYEAELRKIVEKSDTSFEKQLSYISSGALALSFLLVEKVIVDVSGSSYKLLLVAGWLCLAASLLINLLSHRVAARLHNLTIGEIQASLLQLNEEVVPNQISYNFERVAVRSQTIGNYNRWSIWLLFTGIFLILIYTTLNLLPCSTKTQPAQKNYVIYGLQNSVYMNDTLRTTISNTADKSAPNQLNEGIQGSKAPVLPKLSNDSTRGIQGAPPPKLPPVKKPQQK